MAVKSNEIINSIKFLAFDMMDKAGEGNPGHTLTGVPIFYALYSNVLNVIPSNPSFINRDRLIVPSKNYSAALYATLFYAGYDYQIEDLKRYRDVDSYAPGALLYNKEMGIDASSSLAGDNTSLAVGVSLSERYFESMFLNINKDLDLINYYTYVLLTNEDIQEGAGYEAMAFASNQKLNKLIFIYDNSGISSDGNISKTYTEDLETRLDALDFNVINVKNGNNPKQIEDALKDAKKSDMPSFVIVNNEFGYGLENSNSPRVYGSLISNEELINLKIESKYPTESFYVNEEVKKEFNNIINARMEKQFNKWKKIYDEALATKDSNIINIINLLEKGEFNVEFDSTNYQINEKYCEDELSSNQKVMNFIAPKTKFFMGGSADAFKDVKAILTKDSLMTNEDPLGRNIEFGKKESAMAGIVNGLSMSNLRCFCSCNLVYASKMLSFIRSASMQKLPVTYIFGNDSVNSDGMAYSPVEEISHLRLIPDLVVLRPADINEIIGSWEYIIKNKRTVALILSNEKINVLKHTNGKYVKYGAYIVRKEKYHLDAVIIATGYEVTIALEIASQLALEGIDIRVVSMPSAELFMMQNPIYEEKLLPKDVLTFTLESGKTNMWNRFASNPKCAIGIDDYAVSGKKKDVLKFLGFDINSIIIKIKNMLEK